jgi:hypothetical protein
MPIALRLPLNTNTLRCLLIVRRVQYSAEIDNEVDERPNQRLTTGQRVNTVHRLPLIVDLFHHHQPMGTRSTMRFRREQVVFTVCPSDQETLNSHRDCLFLVIFLDGREQRLVSKMSLLMP